MGTFLRWSPLLLMSLMVAAVFGRMIYHLRRHRAQRQRHKHRRIVRAHKDGSDTFNSQSGFNTGTAYDISPSHSSHAAHFAGGSGGSFDGGGASGDWSSAADGGGGGDGGGGD
ncbi:MAG: hypothetical protein JWP59_148 [Massilia sp.]|nr:hypothetical protein [Massilia sp.]